jgi:hypothetical protein
LQSLREKKPLELAGEPTFPVKPEERKVYGNQTPPAAEPRPTLELAEGGAPPPRSTPQENLATNHTAPTTEFPLRQEVIVQLKPEIDAFRLEAARLEAIARSKYPIGKHGDAKRAKAAEDLVKLTEEFGAGMAQLGVDNAAEAHGLNRPLYDAGKKTKLPIKKTLPPTNGKGWVLHRDKDHNQAYVGPNGEVEEVR